MKRYRWHGLAVFLAAALPAAGQAVPTPAPTIPSEPVAEAMLYERDFELLLEQAGVPTAGQLALDEQLAALAFERAALSARREALRLRLASITGTFTMVQAAEEMTRQGVQNLREARENLGRELAGVDAELTRLDRKERELKERRAR